MRKPNDRAAFLAALKLWDRPERELFGRPLAADTDTDDFIDRALSAPGKGVIRS